MKFIKNLENKVVKIEYIDEKPAEFSEFIFDNPNINLFLRDKKLYTHQVEAIKLIKKGNNVVITTPTASGKSFIYLLSILDRFYKNPSTKALLIFPLKALSKDQKKKILDFIQNINSDATVEIYDGDTSKQERSRIKENPPTFLITTPDMLNQGILPNHRSWSDFFKNLEFIMIDEIHYYKGVFGSHIANVLRRLKRIINYYNRKKPIFIMNSATVHNPVSFAQKLTGETDIKLISKSGAPSPLKKFIIMNNLHSEDLVKLLIKLVKNKLSSIIFVNNRKDTEILYKRIITEDRKIINLVSPYRSGYTPEEREEIENKLQKGKLKLVISTNALEAGIDIGELDCSIVYGYPGTLSALWQRFGRAGRRDKEAYYIYIPKNDVLDKYFVKNPQEFFKRDVEEVIINPENEKILSKHILSMARELPIDLKELDKPHIKIVNNLLKEGKLRYINGKLYSNQYINFSIRSAGEQFTIYDENRKIGTLNEENIIYEAHPKAIYLHNGERYIVENVDYKEKVVYVRKYDIGNYITYPIKDTEINIINITGSKDINNIQLFVGEVEVLSKVIGYSKIDIGTDKKINDIFFDEYLEKRFITEAFWFTLPNDIEKNTFDKTKKSYLDKLVNLLLESDILKDYIQLLVMYSDDKSKFRTILDSLVNNYIEDKKKKEQINEIANKFYEEDKYFVGALHGTEHAMIGIYPLFAMNDRWDIGGMSTPFHQTTGKATIFIYDGYEGGIGYAKVGFERFDEIIQATYKSIKNCKCLTGCPSCIFSPKCGNANEYLDKEASLNLLEKLISYINTEK
ncbi:hypothetical protein JCM14244_09790 [Venenivibrio stagnispumantis]|uniref:DEAD/DEAH box helicase domain-containing protein n=1 Tax=Venenivibrio stagnispumantis TaxID=407998 RepID=A0AA46AEQ2_9AQUI|nr:DEAD/DEAH box helicase [Venenivibrio stagnispumantis]MCW4573616.1 DEAD/DEAH box helicase [Venenivibrio stagnispumantis]SMP14133.1 DEAD/DEAH box helicase domain-containing protein [Venenivibrio stagnispumantis]